MCKQTEYPGSLQESNPLSFRDFFYYKKMKHNATNVIFLIFLTIIFPVIFLLFLYFSFSFFTRQPDLPDRSYHILVTGSSENNNFLNNVYLGASAEADIYDAVVELYVPSSKAEEFSLASLFEYASFVNADGIIAYIEGETGPLESPEKNDGTPIPVVTVGHFNSDFPQISFIGNNFTESGRFIARTTIEMWESGYDLYIVNSESKTSAYSTLMNTLSVSLKNASLYPVTFEKTPMENRDSMKKILLEDNTAPSLIICLTEEDSINISQLATDSRYNNKNKIISFGDNDTITSYYEKGIIDTIISVDQKNTGSRAIKEIFNYKKNKFANNYIYAGLQIKKGVNKK